MTQLPTQERIAEILRDLKQLGGIPPLAAIVKPSVRTLYRHAEDDQERPDMGRATYRELAVLFTELGLIEAYGAADLIKAVGEMERRATSATGGGREEATAAGAAERHKEETERDRASGQEGGE